VSARGAAALAGRFAPWFLQPRPGWGTLGAMSDASPQSSATPPETSAEGASFEESTRRLTQIVAELEGGDLPLERSLQLFEEGVRLARSAQDRLDRAERRVEELLGIDEQGRPILRDLES
jgi:exodeoxyribonuclease VII small subunit